MIKHKCNNVVLPVLPEEPDYLYSIIVDSGLKNDLDNDETVYAIVFSKMPFIIIDSTIVYFVTDNEWKCYFALSSGVKWALSSVTPSDPTAQIAGLSSLSDYIWCSADVLAYPNYNAYYFGTPPVEIIAADEPVALSAFASEYTYTIGSTPSPLVILADNQQPDGGTLSFQWHKRVGGKDGGIVSTEQNFYPPTDTLGTTEYYCLVSNTLNDTVTTEYTGSAIITVVEVKKKRGELIGYILQQCGVPMAWMIAEMLCREKKVAASFYSTLNGAVNDVNSGTIGANADADESGAVACVYTDNGQPNVVLMKDTEEATRITLSTNMTVNLAGHTFSTGDKVGIDINAGDIVIDGRMTGSAVRVSRNDGGNTKAIQLKSAYTGNCTVRGGEYVGISKGATDNACIAVLNGKMNLSNATVIAEDATARVYGVIVNSAGTMSMSHCNVRVNSNHLESLSSYGVSNHGTLTINDCYVMGSFGGVLINQGTLYMRGGVYEGGCAGGLVVTGYGKAYVRDAVIREYDMPDGYTSNNEMRCVGLVIGGASVADNLNVYMDNCDIYGSVRPIALYGNGGEQNNSLYISNSRINLDYTDTGVHIGNDTHKLYLGVGNNFTAEHTNRPQSVITTNGVYVNVMPNE